MSLSFLYPLAWLGAAAVLAPLWLHLHRRQDPNLVRFSALQFLDDQPLARRRPLWPRDWLLLLLRLLGLLLLVAAFAWPYLPEEAAVVIRESRVYLLDNTLSHRADGAFQRARDAIADHVEREGVQTQIAVVELTSQPRVLVGFGDDRAEATRKVRALAPSHQRGSYLAAFRQAERLLTQSLGEDRQIVLAGDSQANQWDEGLNVPPFLSGIEVELPTPATGTPANAALHKPEVRRSFTGDVAMAECVVGLEHQGTVDAVTIVVLVNDREILRREVSLKDQPSSMTIAARWNSDVTDWTRGEVRLEAEDDVLAGDDRVFFSLPPVREGRVGVLARSPFLKTAVSTEVMRGRWIARELTPDSIGEPSAEDDSFDVLVVESGFLDDARVRARILDFVNGGRGVLLMIDRLSPLTSGFLRELGVEAQDESARLVAQAGFRYVF
ncbi:MAG: BatA domain-containing protein, partial [Planctomycetes bacterium]|nr:BatA domain-containing protein [Planctomycetota bacterium]